MEIWARMGVRIILGWGWFNFYFRRVFYLFWGVEIKEKIRRRLALGRVAE